MQELDFASLLDSQLSGRWGTALKSLSVVRRSGIHSGERLLDWVRELLEEEGVRTFGDLRQGGPLTPMEERYKLVVTVADITHGRLLRLPWDYHLLGLDPDKQSVAEALRAATAIPLFYQPYRIGGTMLLDGGIVANYPIGVFRILQQRAGRTIGIRLSYAPEVAALPKDIKTPAALARAVITTTVQAQAEESMYEPAVRDNTIIVDVEDVKVTDFSISQDKQDLLYGNGYAASMAFMGRH